MVKVDTRSKRRAIIEAARKIFAMKGYEDTTIAEIAEDAGIAVGTVYLYFGNKRKYIYKRLTRLGDVTCRGF